VALKGQYETHHDLGKLGRSRRPRLAVHAVGTNPYFRFALTAMLLLWVYMAIMR